MKTYLVGGAVRDALMARSHGEAAPSHADRDWVVVGATPEAMVAQGFLPVGRDFPVFLHPHTREEYALARTERKSAPGYHGFVFHTDASVTLEEDLARRDLTINAMAVDAKDAEDPSKAQLIDPYHGLSDLRDRVLRHVTKSFAEDPVRLLRVARFAARWPDFRVAPETMALMRHMVSGGEADHLVPERVWQEISRGLMEQRPSRMFEVLEQCGALPRLVDDSLHMPASVDMAAELHAPLAVRFACLCRGLDDPAALRRLCDRWRVPNDCRSLAEVFLREQAHIATALDLDAHAMLDLLERCDAIRKPGRFDELLLCCAAEMRAASRNPQALHGAGLRLRDALTQALGVNTAQVANEAQKQGLSGVQVGQRIHAARVAAIAAGLADAR